jgi:hypothetical protein
MYKFVDEHYKAGIVSLKIIYGNRLVKIAGLSIFGVFLVTIGIMLMNKGWLVLLSIPLSIAITLLYVYFVKKDIKKKSLKSTASSLINKVSITIDADKLYVETVLKNGKLNQVELMLNTIIKGIENPHYYFLYNARSSAIILSKKGLVKGSIDQFDAFIKSKVRFK